MTTGVDLYSTSTVASTSSSQTSTVNTSDQAGGEMTVDDFYQLLAAQLKYQDPNEPMSNSEMMAQMVQTQMITTLDSMSESIDQLSITNITNYATSMLGQQVTVAEVDNQGNYTGEDTTGTVEGVSVGIPPLIFINGKQYSVQQIMSIGVVPVPVDPDVEDESVTG